MKKNSFSDSSSDSQKKIRPSTTPEGRENQMISMAVDLAEKQLAAGTASSQVITHFLKLGSSKEKLEQEILAEQKKLLIAKTDAINSAQKTEELFREAFTALKSYSGKEDSSDV